MLLYPFRRHKKELIASHLDRFKQSIPFFINLSIPKCNIYENKYMKESEYLILYLFL